MSIWLNSSLRDAADDTNPTCTTSAQGATLALASQPNALLLLLMHFLLAAAGH
jgi:hypothetical protein